MRTVVIGDIHGCYKEAETLISRLQEQGKYDPEADRLIFIGDYIDRGDNPRLAVKYIRELQKQYSDNVIALKGNHEELLLDYTDNHGIDWLFNGYSSTLASYEGYEKEFREDIRWMSELPLYYEDDHFVYDGLSIPTNKAFGLLKCTIKGILQTAKRRRVAKFNIKELLDDLDINDHEFAQNIKEDYQEVFDEEETLRVMNYCYNNLDMQNTAILLTFVTGLRVGELVTLKHEDLKENYISIRRTETRYDDPENNGRCKYDVKEFPKTKAGVRDVAIPKDFQFLLSKMKIMNPFGEYIFTDESGARITSNVIRRRLERICNHLGIYRKSPHKIRKTVNTIMMDYRLDDNLIMGQLGWSDITTGKIHYHRNRKSIEKKVDIISSIPEFQLSKYGN